MRSCGAPEVNDGSRNGDECDDQEADPGGRRPSRRPESLIRRSALSGTGRSDRRALAGRLDAAIAEGGGPHGRSMPRFRMQCRVLNGAVRVGLSVLASLLGGTVNSGRFCCRRRLWAISHRAVGRRPGPGWRRCWRLWQNVRLYSIGRRSLSRPRLRLGSRRKPLLDPTGDQRAPNHPEPGVQPSGSQDSPQAHG